MHVSKIFRTQTPCKHIPKKKEFNCPSQTHQLGKPLFLSWGEINERLKGARYVLVMDISPYGRKFKKRRYLFPSTYEFLQNFPPFYFGVMCETGVFFFTLLCYVHCMLAGRRQFFRHGQYTEAGDSANTRKSGRQSWNFLHEAYFSLSFASN